MHDAAEPMFCHRCGCVLARGELYIVRIEAFADPDPGELPELSSYEIEAEYEQIFEQVRDRSERELMDDVYRRLTMTLCPACYRRWIENPAG